jgi:hypothetical protein
MMMMMMMMILNLLCSHSNDGTLLWTVRGANIMSVAQ